MLENLNNQQNNIQKQSKLPHQKNDLRPEELHETVQEPPALLDEQEKKEALMSPRAKISLPEEHTDVHIGPPKPARKIMPDKMLDAGPDQKRSSPFMELLKKTGIIDVQENNYGEETKKNLRLIMDHLKKTHLLTPDDAIKITGTDKKLAGKYLKILQKKKMIVKRGRGKKTFYKPHIE